MREFDPAVATNLILNASYSVKKAGYEKDYGWQSWGSHGTIILKKKETIEAARYLRTFGPSYLSKIPIHEIENLILKFVVSTYSPLSNYEKLFYEGLPFSAVPEFIKERVSQALIISKILNPNKYFLAFPLSVIRIDDDFRSDDFFLTNCDGLASQLESSVKLSSTFKGDLFPPFSDWGERDEKPIAWLGVCAVRNSMAIKLKNAILGAIALLPHFQERFSHTLRKVITGYMNFENGGSCHSGGPNTPPIGDIIPITARDHGWLEILATKLISSDLSNKKHIKALEYFYRAWFLSPPEKFSVLFQSLDAIFGDDKNASKAVIEGVESIVGDIYSEKRIRLLLGLRGSVVHGGSPDVYESSKYLKYYSLFGEDPIRDTDKIVSACLKSKIFGSAMGIRPHAQAGLFREKMGFDLD